MRLSIPAVMAGVMLGGCAMTGPTAGLPDADSPAVETYARYCGGCHGLPHPGRHTGAEWAALMDIMQQRMQERGMTPPSAGEREAILGYLQVHAR